MLSGQQLGKPLQRSTVDTYSYTAVYRAPENSYSRIAATSVALQESRNGLGLIKSFIALHGSKKYLGNLIAERLPPLSLYPRSKGNLGYTAADL